VEGNDADYHHYFTDMIGHSVKRGGDAEHWTQSIGHHSSSNQVGNNGIANTYIGAYSDAGAGTPNFSMALGANSLTVEEYSIYFGTSSYSDMYCAAPMSIYETGSDKRLKRNITTIPGALNQILGINGVEFF